MITYNLETLEDDLHRLLIALLKLRNQIYYEELKERNLKDKISKEKEETSFL